MHTKKKVLISENTYKDTLNHPKPKLTITNNLYYDKHTIKMSSTTIK